VQTSGPSRPQTVIPEPATTFALRTEDEATAGNDPTEKPSARENPLARKHHTWKNSLWSAVGKNLLRRRAAQNALFPEPTRLKRRVNRMLINQMLELAKGFEPPTL
jgi:hypothetical protein